MARRKNLNDLLSNDRAIVRSAAYSTGDHYSRGSKLTFNSSCSDHHKPLPVMVDGVQRFIHGGNCNHPIKGADVIIGFDSGMRTQPGMFPFRHRYQLLYPIADMGIPANVAEFHNLIKWTIVQLSKERKVFCGCIGGHGRTGLFLAALVKETMGIEDAITYVRENYCHKVVESTKQTKFLHEQFGIKPVTGSKEGARSFDDATSERTYYPQSRNTTIWS